MALNAAKVVGKGGAKQETLDPGVYPARLVQIIDLGLQAQRPYQGQEKPPAQEIMLTYELSDEFMKDEDGEDIEDKPRWVSETIPLNNLKADKAKSTLRYKALDPDMNYGGDFSQCLGIPVNVTLVNNESKGVTYTNVAGIAAMRPKDAARMPELVNDSKFFDLDDPDMEVFTALPEWIREKIKSNLNFQGSVLQQKLGNAPAADKPAKEKQAKKDKPVAGEEDEDRPF